MGEFSELDDLKKEKKRSYERFKEHGEAFIDVMDEGVPEVEDLWASADQIYEASDVEKTVFSEESGNRTFTSIYNILCDAEILTAFHDSAPYEIKTTDYDSETLVKAWEHVSGEEYGEDTETEDNVLGAQDLYESLKD